MVFSADDRVLIKVLRQEKGYGAKKFIAEFPSKPDLGEAAGACVSQPDSWRWPAEVTPDQRVGTFPPGVHRWSDQAVASTSSSFHSNTRRAYLKTYFSYVWYLYRRKFRQSYVCAVAYSGHFCFGGDLTKPSITIASVDRFYLNLFAIRQCIVGSDIVCQSHDNVYRGLLF